jgi:hypothetical protein
MVDFGSKRSPITLSDGPHKRPFRTSQVDPVPGKAELVEFHDYVFALLFNIDWALKDVHTK